MLHALAAIFVAYPEIPITLLLVAGLTIRWFSVPSDQQRTEWMLVVAALAIPGSAFAEWIATMLSRLRPFKYDEYIYRFDGYFGQPSFALGKFAAHHVWCHDLIGISYGLLSIAMVGTIGVYLYCRSRSETITVVWAFALNLFAAVPFYLALPVSGPAFAFGSFPEQKPVFGVPTLLSINSAPNGFPSVHTSTALLVLFFLWPWRWGQVAGISFLGLTVVATLGSGQHYLFDLFASAPYAVGMWFVSHHAFFSRLSKAPDP